LEEIDIRWDEQEEEEETLANEEENEVILTNEEEIEERIRREYEMKLESDQQRIKKLEEENKQLKENQNEEEDPSPIQDMKTTIKDLLKKVRLIMSEEEEDIYFKIKNDIKQDQDEETMRGYEEELRKILNK